MPSTVSSDDDLSTVNAQIATRLRRRERAERGRALLRTLGRRGLTFYWLVCLAVIGLGLNRVYPAPARHLAWAFRDPVLDLTAPFASCEQAQANGYLNIPRESRAYVAAQDPDGDGRACDMGPGRWPDPSWRLRTIQDRLRAPW